MLVGPVGWDADEIVRAARAARIRLAGYVPDDDLAALYAGCELFCYPSLYEGFGLPVLEAMRAGAPVVTSNLSSLPEVAGDAAMLVDPLSVAAIADAIARLLTTLRSAIGCAHGGRARAAQFSWERTAREVRDVLRALAGVACAPGPARRGRAGPSRRAGTESATVPPAVSIAIPTYNRVATLERAVRSALGQTHPGLEVVVSDNASTDGTNELLARLAAEDARLRTVRQEANHGMVANLNAALALARGEHVMLLSDDDWLAPDCVGVALEALRQRSGAVAALGT